MTVQETDPLTTETGTRIADGLNTERPGVGGPVPIHGDVLPAEPARAAGAGTVTTSTPRRRPTGHATAYTTARLEPLEALKPVGSCRGRLPTPVPRLFHRPQFLRTVIRLVRKDSHA